MKRKKLSKRKWNGKKVAGGWERKGRRIRVGKGVEKWKGWIGRIGKEWRRGRNHMKTKIWTKTRCMDKNEGKATYRKIIKVTGVYKRRTRSIREEKAA